MGYRTQPGREDAYGEWTFKRRLYMVDVETLSVVGKIKAGSRPWGVAVACPRGINANTDAANCPVKGHSHDATKTGYCQPRAAVADTAILATSRPSGSRAIPIVNDRPSSDTVTDSVSTTRPSFS